jgi:hypothetical protein
LQYGDGRIDQLYLFNGIAYCSLYGIAVLCRGTKGKKDQKDPYWKEISHVKIMSGL